MLGLDDAYQRLNESPKTLFAVVLEVSQDERHERTQEQDLCTTTMKSVTDQEAVLSGRAEETISSAIMRNVPRGDTLSP